MEKFTENLNLGNRVPPPAKIIEYFSATTIFDKVKETRNEKRKLSKQRLWSSLTSF